MQLDVQRPLEVPMDGSVGKVGVDQDRQLIQQVCRAERSNASAKNLPRLAERIEDRGVGALQGGENQIDETVEGAGREVRIDLGADRAPSSGTSQRW